ncbi:MAG: nucleotidyltransferase domain-containing protein [Bacteroidota bacterium]
MESIQNPSALIETLNERAKELQCLYRIDLILKDFNSELSLIFTKLIEAIPPGWQFPHLCYCSITFENKIYSAPGFVLTEWLQSSKIIVDTFKIGEINVQYSEKVQFIDNSPFLAEEQKLLNTIADRIGNYIFNRRLKEVFGLWSDANNILNTLEKDEGRLVKILTNTDLNKVINYLDSPSKEIHSPEELEKILDSRSEKHWNWRFNMSKVITEKILLNPKTGNYSEKYALERFGVVAVYLIGSVKNANSGPCSDIDLLIHFRGNEIQKSNLQIWIEGWSLCLAEMNLIKTGFKTDGLIDLHIITDNDIQSKSSFASKINAVTDSAKNLYQFVFTNNKVN